MASNSRMAWKTSLHPHTWNQEIMRPTMFATRYVGATPRGLRTPLNRPDLHSLRTNANTTLPASLIQTFARIRYLHAWILLEKTGSNAQNFPSLHHGLIATVAIGNKSSQSANISGGLCTNRSFRCSKV